MAKAINPKNQYRKGEMIVNNLGWPGIVMEATRGNDPAIINLVEMFGYSHECGSIYTDNRVGEMLNEESVCVVRRINKKEFEALVETLGYKAGDYYFRGELLEPNLV